MEEYINLDEIKRRCLEQLKQKAFNWIVLLIDFEKSWDEIKDVIEVI
ncbi:hypothetical protein HYD89_02385 [Mycoplasmopsis bovis]|nr:hypothetical protein [Mycoplasmopsis bovis]QQH36191.1 hypothetical protein HYD89_02385 [Mycoplasmopsis bovis]